MRIAVNCRFMKAKGNEGVGRFSREVLFRLLDRHPDWTFFLLFDRPWDRDFTFPANARPKVLLPPAKTRFLWLFWFDGLIPRFFKKNQIDLFLSFDGYLSLKSRIPTVLVVHDLAYLHFPDHIPRKHLRFYRDYISRYCKKADHIVAVSEFTAKDIQRHFRIPENRISVACNGPGIRPHRLTVDQKEKVRLKYSDGKPFFLYLGAVHPRKNVGRLIRAFDLFKQKTEAPTNLLIAGRMAWKTGPVQEARNRARYRDSIRFLGHIPDEEIAGLLSSCLAFTYVSLFEGFGIPILEAMQADVPVITSNRSSMPEVAGEAALLVDPEKEEDIASAMKRIWEDEGLRQDLIEKGRVQQERFSWKRAVDVVERALMNCKR
jgi:glycosyltransferase involved in cell wall biosynthesis